MRRIAPPGIPGGADKSMALPPVLMYHRIGNPPPNTTVRGHYVAPSALERHLRLLRSRHLASIPTSACLEPNDRGVLITFDDGYADFASRAAPRLSGAGFTAICFVCTGLLGSHNVWDASLGDVRESLLDEQSIRRLAAEGFAFGVHTAHHADLTRVGETALQGEIDTPREVLSGLLGREIDDFCYPYGRYDDEVRRAVARAGYRRGFATGRGVPGDPYAIGRINVRRDTTPLVLAYKLLRHRIRGGR